MSVQEHDLELELAHLREQLEADLDAEVDLDDDEPDFDVKLAAIQSRMGVTEQRIRRIKYVTGKRQQASARSLQAKYLWARRAGVQYVEPTLEDLIAEKADREYPALRAAHLAEVEEKRKELRALARGNEKALAQLERNELGAQRRLEQRYDRFWKAVSTATEDRERMKHRQAVHQARKGLLAYETVSWDDRVPLAPTWDGTRWVPTYAAGEEQPVMKSGPYGRITNYDQLPDELKFPTLERDGNYYEVIDGEEYFVRAVTEEEVVEGLNRLSIVDLGEVMRNGSTDPEMLVEDLIEKGVYNLWYGPKECGKTWIFAHSVKGLIESGQTVVWIDKEMGRKSLAGRLEALGADPAAVSAHLVYLEFPVLSEEKEVRSQWEQLLDARKPVLVGADAQMEVLADAGLNENHTADVLKWLAWYYEPARRRGITTLMLDHTGHDAQGRTRGASGKGQAAKVELEFTKVTKFDRDTIGKVEVARNKNTNAAPIPEKQSFHLGGSPFTLEPVTVGAWDGVDPGNDPTWGEKVEKVYAVIRDLGPISSRQLRTLVRDMRDKDKDDAAAWLRDAGRVRVEKKGVSLMWSVTDPDPDRVPGGYYVAPQERDTVVSSEGNEGTVADRVRRVQGVSDRGPDFGTRSATVAQTVAEQPKKGTPGTRSRRKKRSGPVRPASFGQSD